MKEVLEKKYKKIDIVLIILFPVLATVLTIVLNTGYLVSTLLFFIVPALYLSIRRPKLIFKTFIFIPNKTIIYTIIIERLKLNQN